jgi:N-methylhydantoinase A/oxoprolinase/acetone carboxylase beta subunit
MDLRYTGQGYELRTSLEGLYGERLDDNGLRALRKRFDERHAQIHGHAARERAVEVVSYRLRLRVAVPKYQPVPERFSEALRPLEVAVKGTRSVYFGSRYAETARIYERERLDIGIVVPGVGIIEQFDATTVIPRGWTATVDTARNLVLEKQ